MEPWHSGGGVPPVGHCVWVRLFFNSLLWKMSNADKTRPVCVMNPRVPVTQLQKSRTPHRSCSCRAPPAAPSPVVLKQFPGSLASHLLILLYIYLNRMKPLYF